MKTHLTGTNRVDGQRPAHPVLQLDWLVRRPGLHLHDNVQVREEAGEHDAPPSGRQRRGIYAQQRRHICAPGELLCAEYQRHRELQLRLCRPNSQLQVLVHCPRRPRRDIVHRCDRHDNRPPDKVRETTRRGEQTTANASAVVRVLQEFDGVIRWQ